MEKYLISAVAVLHVHVNNEQSHISMTISKRPIEVESILDIPETIRDLFTDTLRQRYDADDTSILLINLNYEYITFK